MTHAVFESVGGHFYHIISIDVEEHHDDVEEFCDKYFSVEWDENMDGIVWIHGEGYLMRNIRLMVDDPKYGKCMYRR